MVLIIRFQNARILSAKNAYALVHARICNGAEASLPLRCRTSIIRSGTLVQASSSLSMGRTRRLTTEATRHTNAFLPFSREFEYVV